MTAGGIFHNQADELVGIHKHEAKILLDLCKEKNMKNCQDQAKALRRMVPSLCI
jgi:hypothetical protein